MCDFMLKLNSRGLIGLTSYYCQENNKCILGNEGEQNPEVKRAQAGVVRGWVTVREGRGFGMMRGDQRLEVKLSSDEG